MLLLKLMISAFILTHHQTVGDVSCKDTLFTENEDEIESPEIATDSQETIDCIYDIKLAMKSRWIKLSWRQFDLLGTMPLCDEAGYVEVYTGCTDRYLMARFCSSNMVAIPHDIYSKEGCLRIKYHSSPYPGRKRGAGFKATYESYSESFSPFIKACQPDPEFLMKTSGVVASPGWPNEYDKKDFVDGSCKWSIKSPNKNQMIQINFFDIMLTKLDYLKREDEFVLKGKLSSSSNKMTPFKRTYKGKYPPFTENTDSYQVNGTMTIDSAVVTTSWSKYVRNDGGFAFGYVIYNPISKVLDLKTTLQSGVPKSTNSVTTTKQTIKTVESSRPATTTLSATTITALISTVGTSRENNTTDDSVWDKIPWKIIAYVVLALIGTVVFALLTGAGAKKVCNCNLSVNLSSGKNQQSKGYQTFDTSDNSSIQQPDYTGANRVLIESPQNRRDNDDLTNSPQPPFSPNVYPPSSIPSAPLFNDQDQHSKYNSPSSPPDYAPPSYQELIRADQNEKAPFL